MVELTKAEIKKGYKSKAWCYFCDKWAYSTNERLIPRHQHIGFGTTKLKTGGKK